MPEPYVEGSKKPLAVQAATVNRTKFGKTKQVQVVELYDPEDGAVIFRMNDPRFK